MLVCHAHTAFERNADELAPKQTALVSARVHSTFAVRKST
jgi:hypothetical protein